MHNSEDTCSSVANQTANVYSLSLKKMDNFIHFPFEQT